MHIPDAEHHFTPSDTAENEGTTPESVDERKNPMSRIDPKTYFTSPPLTAEEIEAQDSSYDAEDPDDGSLYGYDAPMAPSCCYPGCLETQDLEKLFCGWSIYACERHSLYGNAYRAVSDAGYPEITLWAGLTVREDDWSDFLKQASSDELTAVSWKLGLFAFNHLDPTYTGPWGMKNAAYVAKLKAAMPFIVKSWADGGRLPFLMKVYPFVAEYA